MEEVWCNEWPNELETTKSENDEPSQMQGLRTMGAAGFEPATSHV